MKINTGNYFDSLAEDSDQGDTLRGIPPAESDADTPPKRYKSNGEVGIAYGGHQDASFGFGIGGVDGMRSAFAIDPVMGGEFGGLIHTTGTGGSRNGNNAFTMAYGRSGRAYGKSEEPARVQYYKDGMPVTRELKWGKLQANVPVIAPYSERPIIKNQIFEKAVTAIERANASSHDKVDALNSIFESQCPGAHVMAATAIADLLRFDSNAFRFARIEARAQNGAVLDPEDPQNANDFPPNFRAAVQWFHITLIVQPRQIGAVPDLGIDPTQFPIEEQASVFIVAPKINGTLPGFFTPDIIIDPAHHRTLVAAYALSNQPFTPAKLRNNSPNGVPEASVFEDWLNGIKARTMYQALAQAIKAQYVGKLEGLLSVGQRLQRIGPQIYNAETKQNEFQKVNDIFKQYQQIMQEIDPANPSPDIPDLANQFMHSLPYDLQKRVYELVPAGAPAGFADNLRRLHVFKLACEKEEGNLSQLVRIVKNVAPAKRYAHSNSNLQDDNGTPGRTFATMRQPDFTSSPSTAMQGLKLAPAAPFAGHNGPTDNYLMAPYCLQIGNEEMAMTLPADLATEAEKGNKWAEHTILLMATMSAAETALADASGSKFPRTCWGCDTAGHTFRDCPHKADRKVADNFFKNVREWKLKRQANYNGSQQWRSGNGAHQAGYMTTQIHDYIQKIADPATTPEHRTQYLQALANKVIQESPKPPKPSKSGALQFTYFLPNSEIESGEQAYPKKATKGTSFAMMEHQGPKLTFAVNATLAFIAVPVGPSLTNGIEIKGLYDTGGCCTMGWYDYHHAISQRHPEIVKDFHELEKYRFEPIAIGGIEDGQVKITHLVEYYLPYDDGNGNPHTMLIGLVDKLPLNTIFGLPFIIKAEMKADFNEMLVYSRVLDDEFKITMERPTLIPVEELDHMGHLKNKTYTNIKTDYSSHDLSSKAYAIVGDIDGHDPQEIGNFAV